MKYYGSSNLNTKFKVDEFDPVTQADFESEKYILEEIKKHFPDDKILSEETENTLR
ncbi:inositol monophosphatase, partial [bacterium]|nr:inositol monophosphatase [bacterium]